MTDFIGTGGQDVLSGAEGDDLILGLGGDDFIYGEDGDDVLKGGSGGDVICDRFDIQNFSANGDDVMLGGAGDDQLVSLEGHDHLVGGKGNDDLVIYRHIDDNDDNIVANGGAGDDSFYFSSYNAGQHVKLYGGAGDDRFELWGSKGLLHVDLGTGHDMVWAASRYADGDGPVMISHFEAGDEGDVLVLDGSGMKGAPKYIQGLLHLHKGDNPFADGHLRLVQDGHNVVLEVDPNGQKSGENFSVSLIFKDADIGDFTAANFGGYDPHPTDGLVT